MDKLVIMDYSKGSVDIYTTYPKLEDDTEIVEALGHNSNDCSWMFVKKLSINFITEND